MPSESDFYVALVPLTGTVSQSQQYLIGNRFLLLFVMVSKLKPQALIRNEEPSDRPQMSTMSTDGLQFPKTPSYPHILRIINFIAQMNTTQNQPQSPNQYQHNGSHLISSIVSQQPKAGSAVSLELQNYKSKIETHLAIATYHDKSTQDIENCIHRIRQQIRQYEEVIDKKISKYYTNLREDSPEKTPTVQTLVQCLTNEKKLRQDILIFQQVQIRDITEMGKAFDSKENIEFAIPLEINHTKKKILDVEKFNHIAKIREKKKSEDLVKVEKVNNQQFEKTAMLRTTLQVEMIYELSLNERELKIDQRMRDFQNKIETANAELAKLTKIVQQKHILVSSNKTLILLKEKQHALLKSRDEERKKIGLINNNVTKAEFSIHRDMEAMRKDMYEKETRFVVVEKELSEIVRKNQSFLINQDMGKSLRKSISYNYADTLLKMKNKAKAENPNMVSANQSMLSQSLTLKPNFKVKTIRNKLHFSLAKMPSTKKDISVAAPLFSYQLETNPESLKKSLLKDSLPTIPLRGSIRRIAERKQSQILDEEIIVDQ